MKISSIIRTIIVTSGILLPASAFADCSEVGSGHWNELSARMGQAYEQGDYSGALDYGKQLAFICDKSPIFNYMLSETYAKLDREDEALSAIRRATDFLHTYDVPQNLIEKIWLRRGELELPYKRQAKELQAQLDAKQIEMEALDEAYKEQLASQAKENSSSMNSAVATARDNYIDNLYDIQWTGTGIAAGGAAIAIAGAAVIGMYYGRASSEYNKLNGGDSNNNKNNHFNEYNSYEKFGYAFLAAGLGLGVAGMVTAVISHLKIKKAETTAQETAFKLDISPSYVGMTVNF